MGYRPMIAHTAGEDRLPHPLGRFALIADHPVLQAFSPAVAEWFASSFPSPTPPQVEGWPHIVAGEHTLICAPTGSGKTLTAFLASIDRLVTDAAARTHAPTARGCCTSRRCGRWRSTSRRTCGRRSTGIGLAAERIGVPFTAPEVAMRTGDTESNERQRLIRRPPDLLITTPESLYLMLTSSARETLQRRRDRDRRRDPRHGHHQARRPSGAHARAARGGHRPAAATDRAVGHATPAGGDGPLPRRLRRRRAAARAHRRHRRAQAARDRGRRARSTTCRRPARRTAPVGEAGSGERRSSIWPSIYPRVLELGARPPLDDHLLQRPPRPPSGSPPSSTSSTRSSTARPRPSCSGPTTARSPASNA